MLRLFSVFAVWAIASSFATIIDSRSDSDGSYINSDFLANQQIENESQNQVQLQYKEPNLLPQYQATILNEYPPTPESLKTIDCKDDPITKPAVPINYPQIFHAHFIKAILSRPFIYQPISQRVIVKQPVYVNRDDIVNVDNSLGYQVQNNQVAYETPAPTPYKLAPSGYGNYHW